MSRRPEIIKREMADLAIKTLRVLNETNNGRHPTVIANEKKMLVLDDELKAAEAQDAVHRKYGGNLESLASTDPSRTSWRLGDVGEPELGGIMRGKAALGEGAPPLVFSESLARKAFSAAQQGIPFRAELKVVDESTAGGAETRYDRTSYPFLREGSRVLDLLPTEAIDTPLISYVRQTTAAAGAAMVAEGATKPQSNPAWTRFNVTATKIAHWAEVTNEALNDFLGFSQLLQEELMAGLILKESDGLLNGDGTGQNLLGILNASGILTRVRATEAGVETIKMAMTDLRVGSSYVEPDGIIMHPTTWQSMRLTKDANQQYYGGGPFTGAYGSGLGTPNSLWGCPVVLTTQIATGTAVVGNFTRGTKVYIREAPRIAVNPYSETAWLQNKTRIICEERLGGVAVTRPTAIVKVTNLP